MTIACVRYTIFHNQGITSKSSPQVYATAQLLCGCIHLLNEFWKSKVHLVMVFEFIFNNTPLQSASSFFLLVGETSHPPTASSCLKKMIFFNNTPLQAAYSVFTDCGVLIHKPLRKIHFAMGFDGKMGAAKVVAYSTHTFVVKNQHKNNPRKCMQPNRGCSVAYTC